MESRFATQRLKLALIGPVAPFRGGIAQYTTELRRALIGRCDLLTVSFRRQYPAWLYPGKSDREPGEEFLRDADVSYVLDALNPASWVAAARAIAAHECNVALMNWWTLFWAPGFALIARNLRSRGIPVVLICHNFFDHDSGKLKRRVSTRLLANADAYLVHTEEQASLLRRIFPGKPVRVHPHPPHQSFPPPNVCLPKRGRLELLFFGFIRPYKGLMVLVEALARLADREVFLSVVGEPWCPADELRKQVLAAGAPNIELHLDYVDAQAVANFFARADLVTLPYLSATGSAVAAVATHYDRPILATRVGGFPDVVDEGHTGFLVEPGSSDQIVERLRTLTRAELDGMRERIRAGKSRFSWTSLAGALNDLAFELMAGSRH